VLALTSKETAPVAREGKPSGWLAKEVRERINLRGSSVSRVLRDHARTLPG
jgi:hypothetical protein